MDSKKIFIFIILIFLVFKILLSNPTFSDDSFYFNVAREISNGKLPYIDFFFAHPPLQVYLLAGFFKVFSASYFLGKAYSLLISIFCLFMVYRIAKELYDKKTAFVASFIFLITPTFIAFSSVGYGMWETALFVLISTYFLVKGKPLLASISFLISILFRYVAIFYLPLLLLIFYLKKGKLISFILPFLVFSLISFAILFLLFGKAYFNQTFLYHIFSKVQVARRTQYLGIGLFSYFLSVLSAVILYSEKDRIGFSFALVTLVVDPLIMLAFGLTFYHYFLVSLSFCMIAVGRVLCLKYSDVRAVILVIFSFFILLNLQTVDFYLNPVHAQNFLAITKLVEENTLKGEKIFGEPIMTNYVSLVTGREVAGNYFDSYLQHLTFEGTDKVVKKLEADKPKVVIEMESYYLTDSVLRDFILGKYRLVKSLEGVPSYSVYVLR
jgi:4-amino-4-deoxy-L-arabinose transferase-like glycosyltransferase